MLELWLSVCICCSVKLAFIDMKKSILIIVLDQAVQLKRLNDKIVGLKKLEEKIDISLARKPQWK